MEMVYSDYCKNVVMKKNIKIYNIMQIIQTGKYYESRDLNSEFQHKRANPGLTLG